MAVRRIARAVPARVTAASQAAQQPSQPAAPQPLAGQTARARGAEETMNAAYIRGAKKEELACAKAHAFLNRDELDAALGAALAYRRVRAAGAAARTRKPVHCKRRDESAQRYIGRVIG
jgi:hypothetical protein